MATVDNILFNALKHHRAYICEQMQQATLATLPDMLKTLGDSQMDVYYGALDLATIFTEVIAAFSTDEVFYTRFLKENNGYIEITLSDDSRWVLLHGTEPGKYIHIHPARYSLHSLRVKATILKTAIALLVNGGDTDLETLNHIRVSVLQLSPVKTLEQCTNLWKVMEMLKG